MNTTLILIILLVPINFLFGFHPPYDRFDKSEKDSLDLYVSADIYLKSNNINIEGIILSNYTDKDIYVFWNSFVFQNLIQDDNSIIKKTAYMNELTIFRNESRSIAKYIDSTSNAIPVLIKFPKNSERKKRPQNKGQSIELFFNDLNEFISTKDQNLVKLKVTINYLESEDVEFINEKFGINLADKAIMPLDTKISTFSRLKESYGYVDCFNSNEINRNLNEFHSIISSKIKHLTIYIYPAIFESDPNQY